MTVGLECWIRFIRVMTSVVSDLSDLELSDDDLLGRLLSTVLFDDGGSCRFIRSVVAVVNGYRAHRG